jgi:hypothetical protein
MPLQEFKVQVQMTEFEFEQQKSKRSWHRSDFGLLQSEAGIKKIHRQFEKTPWNFRLFPVIRNCTSFNSLMFAPYDYFEKKSLRDKDAITCVYGSNFGADNLMPLNAWQLAHRFGHAVSIMERDPMMRTRIRNFGEILDQTYLDVTESPGNTIVSKKHLILPEFGKFPDSMLNVIMTQRSARECLMTTGLDYFPELLAQFIITGSIKLLRVEGWQERKAQIHKRIRAEAEYRAEARTPYTNYAATMDEFINLGLKKKAMEVNSQIQHLEDQLNVAFKNLLDACVGKTFSF